MEERGWFGESFLLRTSLVAQWIRIHCQCKGHQFNPQSGRIPHAMEQLSPCHNYWSSCTYSLCSATREATAMGSQCARMKSRPFLLQLEKASSQKRRPRAAKRKKKKWRRLPLAMNFDVSDTSQISRFLVINYITHSSYCTWKRNLSEDVKWLTKPLGEPDSKSGLEALQPGAMLAYPHGWLTQQRPLFYHCRPHTSWDLSHWFWMPWNSATLHLRPGIHKVPASSQVLLRALSLFFLISGFSLFFWIFISFWLCWVFAAAQAFF